MSVNIFGGGRNTAAIASHVNAGVVGNDRNMNQILILLSKSWRKR